MRAADVHVLPGNADCVEFCPTTGCEQLLAVGTYTLEEAAGGDGPQQRRGGVHVFQLSPGCRKLVQAHHAETAGVLDLAWRPAAAGDGRPQLAQAGSNGCLTLYHLEGPDATGEATEAPLALVPDSCQAVSSGICLCVDWQPARGGGIALGLADGSLCLVADVGCSSPTAHRSWTAHRHEVWAAAHDLWSPHVLYSGSDDCSFCAWDVRAPTSRPAFRDATSHSAGVCSIRSSPLCGHVVATGSYDEAVRYFDVRRPSAPTLVQSTALGGGAWRLRWHPWDASLLLVAAMHAGFAILRNGTVTETYTEHKSLAYGADWYQGLVPEASQDAGAPSDEQPVLTSKASCLVATCSFYDRALHLWEPHTTAWLHT